MAQKEQRAQKALRDPSQGMDLLNRPALNKSTAFSDGERTAFHLHGLLPPHVEMPNEQALRAAAPDGASAPECPAVAIQGRYAHQGRDL